MPGEIFVIDASTLGSAFFEEVGTPTAQRFLLVETELIAPALLAFEMASIGAKKVWKGLASSEVAERAVASVSRLVILIPPDRDLAVRAFQLAVEHRFSAYDAAYLALAETRSACVATLDHKFADRAERVGLGRLILKLAS